ncbi:class I SAM-dependent methyltransferase [Motiliproteus sp. MSK22-1]|uniref:class I SAM-dependent methyltransferase n=1 Tax=Motiliproteus sp. MSK22-1 TaxID=1897630 RepID=UPI000977AE29|nr:class I SAM-dependent methyltransferase [Motiliproteus sp. MSK22-1]OMH25922.1 methyltransferase [Motiliproteus sp. MSK22-1]
MQPIFDAIYSGLNESSVDAKRLFHGRGHCYDGLEFINVDLLPPVVFITLYNEIDLAQLKVLVDFTARHQQVEGVLVQHRYKKGAPSEVFYGNVPDSLDIVEAGLIYQICPGQKLNSGFFLDMSEGRQWVRLNSRNTKVLNLFAYTCGFSVAAMAGGAAQVVNLDMSRGALERGRENHRLNNQDMSRVRFLPYELFRSWGRLKKMGPFERIIIDPPSFQKGSFVASKDYQRVLKRLPELLSSPAQVLLCLNDPATGPEFLIDLMKEHCPDARYFKRLSNPETFPERYDDRGLKVLVFNYQKSEVSADQP